MSKGAWNATEVDSVLVAADEFRGEVALQNNSTENVWLGFGEAGVVNQGLILAPNGYFVVNDHRAALAIHGICDTGKTASGGYQTA
jgi:hypothetical protein